LGKVSATSLGRPADWDGPPGGKQEDGSGATK